MAVTVESRAAYGWPRRPNASAAPCRNGIVFHYDGFNQNLAGQKHTACKSYWKNVRIQHMGTNDWNDIGYSFAICPHGIVMTGRGFGFQQAAQPGGNSSWTSITLMSGPSEKPTKQQLAAIREFRQYLMESEGVGASIKGHRDFISTSCPGDIVYGMVKNKKIITGDTSASKNTEQIVKSLPVLKKGAKGAAVGRVQHLLMAAGQKLPKHGADRDFGDETEAALKAVTGSTTCGTPQWQKLLGV